MKSKTRRKLALAMAYVFTLFSFLNYDVVWATASGHYTDILPNPTSASGVGSATLYYNGYDWQMTTVGATTVPGDAISRAPYTGYQSTNTFTLFNTSAVSTYTVVAAGAGGVGSTQFPQSWVASGRSIRITARGRYTTGTTAPTWVWGVNFGTTSIISLSGTAPAVVSTQSFTMSALLNIQTTGNTGTVGASFDVFATTGVATAAAQPVSSILNLVSYSSSTFVPTTVDLTSQLTVNPVFSFGTAATHNRITFTSVIIEYLN